MEQGPADIARQIGWAALALCLAGALVAAVGDSAAGGVLVLLGFVTYVAMQYLRGRYR